MSTEPNGTARPWTAADVRALRTALQRPGLETLPLFGPDCPPVTLDLREMHELVTLGILPNAVLAALETQQEQAIAAMTETPDSPATWRAMTTSTEQHHDAILTAVVRAPKYYSLDQVPPAGCPEDGLHLYDFTPEMRWAILAVLQEGAEALAHFRADPGGFAAELARRRVQAVTERVTDPTSPVAPAVLAGRDADDAATAPAGRRSRRHDADVAPDDAGVVA